MSMKKSIELMENKTFDRICCVLDRELADSQPQAIIHAQKLLTSYDPLDPESDNPATTVHLLVEELNQWIR